MFYPDMETIPSEREMIATFLGYNHNLRIGKGEFFDMENLTSTFFPMLAPRQKRGFYTGGTDIRAMIAKDKLCYVDGKDFVMGTEHIPMGLTPGDKHLISMGAYVIILPDKKYINTADITDRGDIEARVTTQGAVSFQPCKDTGEDYQIKFIQDTAPESPENLDLWLDTSVTPNALKQWSESSGVWTGIATSYLKISSPGIGKPFAQGDGVSIHGLKDVPLKDAHTGEAVKDPDISAIDGSFVIQGRGEDYLILSGMLGTARTLNNVMTVERAMPEIDFCVESGNRLYGCRYGLNQAGDFVNEIYASKLADFKNWNVFSGISTDSYIVSCGSDGAFTGGVAYGGEVIFFKEGCMHKLYGNMPSNYSLQTIACRGVQKGSERSLAIVNEVLYYKSRLGICAYDGSLPVEISAALGDVAYSSAVAGGHGNKYYISMMDNTGVYHLFVYDAARNMWHREDCTQVRDWCSYGNEMYMIDCKDGHIKTVLGSGTEVERDIAWMAQTGLIGTADPDRKYIARLQIRMQLEMGSTVQLYIDYDSLDNWTYVGTMKGTRLQTFIMPVRPKRCDHMRLRFVGTGAAKIFSICKTIEKGSGYR